LGEQTIKGKKDMRSSTRWKSHEAAEAAQEEPVSTLYEQMRNWEPLEAFFAQSSVVLSTNVDQSKVLNRACFGKPIFAASSPLVSATSAPTRKKSTIHHVSSLYLQSFY
jgi:hypothetical protein